MEDLVHKKCVACEGGVAPLTRPEAEILMRQLKDWTLADDAKSISKSYAFKDFKDAFAFATKVAEVAEAEGHQPDLHVAWGSLKIHTWTHSIGGLSENDFIVAAKIDALPL